MKMHTLMIVFFSVGWLAVRKGRHDKNQFVHMRAIPFPHIDFSLLANYFNNEQEFRICLELLGNTALFFSIFVSFPFHIFTFVERV